MGNFLLKAVSNKESSINEYYVSRGSTVSWAVSSRRALRQSEEVQYRELLGLRPNTLLCMEGKDACIWNIVVEFVWTPFQFGSKVKHFRQLGILAFQFGNLFWKI